MVILGVCGAGSSSLKASTSSEPSRLAKTSMSGHRLPSGSTTASRSPSGTTRTSVAGTNRSTSPPRAVSMPSCRSAGLVSPYVVRVVTRGKPSG